MIILIDGPLCSGKTTTAFHLEQKLSNNDITRIDSDEERFKELYNINIREGDSRKIAQYMNDPFCRNLSRIILDESHRHDIVILSMCLAGDSAKKYIVDGLEACDLYHFVLTLSFDALYKRAEADNNPTRDAYNAECLYPRITKYIKENYQSAKRINVENSSASEVVDFIANTIFLNQC